MNAEKTAAVQEMIDDLKRRGYKVYGPRPLSTYVYFTDDTKRIAYAETSVMRGPKYVSVHVPNTYVGTGFEASSPEEALNFAPGWVTGGSARIVKYRDFDTFEKRNWQRLFPL